MKQDADTNSRAIMSFAASKDSVLVYLHGRPFQSMSWDFALELGHAYQDVGEKGCRGICIEHRVTYKDDHRTVRAHVNDCEAIRVLVMSRGIVVVDIEPGLALEIGNAMINRARLAEEYVKHERVISDQALMMRMGGRVSLSGNPDINHEAWKEAETDSTLRKNIPTPASIKSKEKFGYPQVVKGPRTVEEQVANLSEPEREAVRRILLN